jgi:DNA excision repair protein ERCC-2
MAKAEKEGLISELVRERSCLLLATIGGSFAEGVDFRDNLLSAVLVVGLPLAPPSVEGDAIMSRLERRHGPAKAGMYARTYPAVTKVLQAAGRAIRSERDRAAIVLLDDRYLAATVRGAFPSSFRMEESHDLTAELERFYAPPEPSVDTIEMSQVLTSASKG